MALIESCAQRVERQENRKVRSLRMFRRRALQTWRRLQASIAAAAAASALITVFTAEIC